MSIGRNSLLVLSYKLVRWKLAFAYSGMYQARLLWPDHYQQDDQHNVQEGPKMLVLLTGNKAHRIVPGLLYTSAWLLDKARVSWYTQQRLQMFS
jgi:hypothetical protein